MCAKEILRLQKKSNVYFDVKTLFTVPHYNSPGEYWLLSGGRRGHIGVWDLDLSGDGVELKLVKITEPTFEIRQEVVFQYLIPPKNWSPWGEHKKLAKDEWIEIIALLVGRRDLHKGCTIMSIQFNTESGKLILDSSRFEHFSGENSKASSMVFWKDYLVVGMGQQLTFISNETEERDTIIEFEFECPSEICCLAVVNRKEKEKGQFLVVGGMDKKIRWYISAEDSHNSLTKVHSVKAHSSRLSCMIVHNNILYSGGGASDPGIKSWKPADECEVVDGKRVPGEIKSYSGHSDAILSMGFLGPWLISGSAKGDGSMRVWNLEEENSVQARITPHDAIHALLPLNDKILITGGNSGARKMCIWSTENISCTLKSNGSCIIQ